MSPFAAIERRAADLELRVAGRKLEGYAATFGTEARIGDFVETISPGAFSASLGDKSDILALVDHDATKVLARTRSGTLRLRQDGKGLAFEIDVPDTQAGHDVLVLAERGDLGGMSFGFRAAPNGEAWHGRKRDLRSILLKEISVITSFPAYEGTSVNARARMDLRHSVRMARLFLETCGVHR